MINQIATLSPPRRHEIGGQIWSMISIFLRFINLVLSHLLVFADSQKIKLETSNEFFYHFPGVHCMASFRQKWLNKLEFFFCSTEKNYKFSDTTGTTAESQGPRKQWSILCRQIVSILSPDCRHEIGGVVINA